MTLIALCCIRQSRAPNTDHARQKFDLDFDLDPWSWPWPLTLILTFDLTLKQGDSDVKTRFLAFDLWPKTLTYNYNLAKVKVNLHTKYQGHRSNGSAWEVGQPDGRYQVNYLPRFAIDN